MSEKIILSNKQARGLIEKYGSPLYVYDEEILRKRCRDIKGMLKYEKYSPNYSTKANTNLSLLKIVREEGFTVDAMSIGEVEIELAAGFTPAEIMFNSNNVTKEEMKYSHEKGIIMSVDSLSQLEMFGEIAKGSKVAVRLNPWIGDGHNKKVVTAGQVKFGVLYEEADKIKEIAARYDLKVVGINQHIGSLFLEDSKYLAACEKMLEVAEEFEDLESINFGGGFGVPYKQEARLDIDGLGKKLDQMLADYQSRTGKTPTIKVEPGRYIVAECGILLGTVTATKEVYGIKYIGTDIGFNVLMRPVLYDSHHEIVIYNEEKEHAIYNVVGNICESGDILAKDRELPVTYREDIIGVENAGAYGFAMASNYNERLRPAEILLSNGAERVIRRRETIEDLMRHF